ncbi:hypothetical protein pipiens_012712 [Culex pipiens pipiens]|uniref:DNA topoisomerase (ATP-hydrolyzing) n=1 Tax=Culex pipiens pipiens TaxID=38569 RepID=A0ABD1D189_CULPP
MIDDGKQLPTKNFKDYIDLYVKEQQEDDIVVDISEKGFQQVSFVNSIATTKEGRHVDYVTDIVVKQLKLKKNMKLQVKSSSSKCVMSEKFVAAVSKRGIVESVQQWAKFKAQTELSKASGSKKSKIQSVPKLEDANEGGWMPTTRAIFYKEIITPDLDLFSNSDNVRSIPCVLDGLKPGQRKFMFTCFKRNDKQEVKVAQLAGSVAEMFAYHHGEQSLCSTIVNLKQNIVSSNNINLLYPRDQFGTRLPGGKVSAKLRFLLTMMSALTRKKKTDEKDTNWANQRPRSRSIQRRLSSD